MDQRPRLFVSLGATILIDYETLCASNEIVIQHDLLGGSASYSTFPSPFYASPADIVQASVAARLFTAGEFLSATDSLLIGWMIHAGADFPKGVERMLREEMRIKLILLQVEEDTSICRGIWQLCRDNCHRKSTFLRHTIEIYKLTTRILHLRLHNAQIQPFTP